MYVFYTVGDYYNDVSSIVYKFSTGSKQIASLKNIDKLILAFISKKKKKTNFGQEIWEEKLGEGGYSLLDIKIYYDVHVEGLMYGKK